MKVLIGGSRHLTEESLITRLLAHVKARGWEVLTGCAAGIDREVRRQCIAISIPLTVYAVGGKEGGGWNGRFGTHLELRALEGAGLAVVQWKAGGEGDITTRLRNRTLAMAEAADWVLMVTAPDSRGSRLALAHARKLGKRVREFRRGETNDADNP